MYSIVFSGRLLDGFAPSAVRSAVAKRLGLTPPQVERLFSGNKVVLKKGVTEESAKLYISVLNALGMNAGMTHMASGGKPVQVQALATFKVVFWGRTLEGFERQSVMQAAAVRLKLSPPQLLQVFSGSKVVLKRSVAAEMGSRYVVELARIGMQIDLEVETQSPPPASAARHATDAQPDPYAGLLKTQYELARQLDSAEEFTAPSQIPTASVQPPYRVSLKTFEPISLPQAMPARAAEYVRCTQCGSRQPFRARCAVCGCSIAPPPPIRIHEPIPMDASAHALPTIVLGNIAAGSVHHSTAAPVRATETLTPVSFKPMQADPAPRRKRFLNEQKSKALVLASVLIGVLWLAW